MTNGWRGALGVFGVSALLPVMPIQGAPSRQGASSAAAQVRINALIEVLATGKVAESCCGVGRNVSRKMFGMLTSAGLSPANR